MELPARVKADARDNRGAQYICQVAEYICQVADYNARSRLSFSIALYNHEAETRLQLKQTRSAVTAPLCLIWASDYIGVVMPRALPFALFSTQELAMPLPPVPLL